MCYYYERGESNAEPCTCLSCDFVRLLYIHSCELVDPTTLTSIGPHLAHFINLKDLKVDMTKSGIHVHSYGTDGLFILESCLRSWRPCASLHSRRLTLVVWGPDQRTEHDILQLLSIIGAVVEEHCSGAASRS